MHKLERIFRKYGVSISPFEKNETIVFIGTLPYLDSVELADKMVQNARELVCFCAIEDELLLEKSKEFIRYEAGCESGVLALLAKTLLSRGAISRDDADYLNELDEGYLSAESNVGEEELSFAAQLFTGEVTIVLGRDIETHPQIDTIIGLISLISRYKKVKTSLFGDWAIECGKGFVLPKAVDELSSFDGTAVYIYPAEGTRFRGSAQFAAAAKINDREEVKVRIKNGEFSAMFALSKNLKGTIALLGLKRHEGFRYEVAKVIKGQ